MQHVATKDDQVARPQVRHLCQLSGVADREDASIALVHVDVRGPLGDVLSKLQGQDIFGPDLPRCASDDGHLRHLRHNGIHRYEAKVGILGVLLLDGQVEVDVVIALEVQPVVVILVPTLERARAKLVAGCRQLLGRVIIFRLAERLVGLNRSLLHDAPLKLVVLLWQRLVSHRTSRHAVDWNKVSVGLPPRVSELLALLLACKAREVHEAAALQLREVELVEIHRHRSKRGRSVG
mmetsp:Transcript_33521/g.83732  ORF Transcript_33521/g.83732 Transcript_33521/m.83732 type:complete len:236 (-) Transcript_33521:6-713(-)